MAVRGIELQRAIYSNLSSGSYVVMASPPTDPVLPLITLGDIIVTDSDSKTNERTVHTVTIHTWSKSNSNMELLQMNDFVIQQIKNVPLVLTGFTVDNVMTELVATMKDADYTGAVYTDIEGVVLHGVLQFMITVSD